MRGLEADQSDAVIVRSVIDLGRNLGPSVVAEGVEDGDTAAHLARLGCTMAQGWYRGRARPAHERQAWLDALPDGAPVRGAGGSVR